MAFFARRPAWSITLGFEVFVHEVMAAITTEPWLRVCSSPLKVKVEEEASLLSSIPKPLKPTGLVRQA